jgi:hypothetical protein
MNTQTTAMNSRGTIPADRLTRPRLVIRRVCGALEGVQRPGDGVEEPLMAARAMISTAAAMRSTGHGMPSWRWRVASWARQTSCSSRAAAAEPSG